MWLVVGERHPVPGGCRGVDRGSQCRGSPSVIVGAIAVGTIKRADLSISIFVCSCTHHAAHYAQDWDEPAGNGHSRGFLPYCEAEYGEN